MDTTQRESQDNIRRMGHIVTQANMLGKAGHPDEAMDLLRPYFERDEVPSFLYMPAGWTVYRYFKAHAATLLPHEGTALLGQYLHICQKKPEMVHSYIMIVATKFAKAHPSEFDFIAFCRQWGVESFRDEDYIEQKSTLADGRPVTFPSLAAKASTILYKAIKPRHDEREAREFLPFFQKVRERCPTFEFAPLYIANLHAWCGEADEAIRMLREMLILSPQWYLWKHLGDLLDGDLRLSCYCKALTMISEEKYLGEIHLALAEALVTDNPPQAVYELSVYTKTYETNHWRVKAAACALTKRLAGVEPAADARQFYATRGTAAEDFAYAGQPQAEFVFTGERTVKSGKRRACLSCQTRHLSVMVPFTPQLRKISVGSILTCRYHTDKGRITLLTIHPTGRQVSVGGNAATTSSSTGQSASRDVEGKVKRHDGWAFAFVADCFIPPSLCQSASFTDGQHVKGKAVRQKDGKWRMVSIQ